MPRSDPGDLSTKTQTESHPLISILYVDDEQALLTLAKIYLERTDHFHVDIRESAEEALKSTSITSYDAIISDYQMPGMDGIEFLKVVREQYGDIPFILFTGRGREEVVIEAINNGADFYLQKGGAPKPQFAELAHKVKQSVRRRRAEAERIDQLNELVLTKEALQESEFRYRAIIETTPDAIWEITLDGTFTYLSPQTREIVGYFPEELIGSGFQSILPPQSLLIIENLLKNAPYRKPGLATFDVPVIHKDGTVRILNCRSYPLLDPDGVQTGFRGVSTDVTERSQYISALQESELRLRSFIEATEDAVFLTDEEGRVIEWNPGSERASGISRNEALGTYIWDLAGRMVIPDHRNDQYLTFLKEKIKTALQSGTPVFCEPRVAESVRTDGTRVYFRQTVFPIKTDKGYRFGSISRDITDEKRITEALLESEERFRGIAERSPDLIFILDAGMKPVYVSPSSRLIIGYEPDELVGRDPEFALATIFSLSGSAITDAVERTRRGEIVENIEITVTKKDGSSVLMHLYAVPVIHGGIFSGAQVSMRDITRIRGAELALRNSEEKFVTMFQKNPVPLTLVSLPDSIFTDVNEAFIRSSGYSRDDVIGKKTQDLGIFVYPDEYYRLATEIREKGYVSGMDMHCMTKGGEIKNVLFSSRLVDIHGQPGVISTIEDITELKSAESAMNAIVAAIVQTTGKESLDRIVQSIRSWLNADCVMIGTIDVDKETFHILSMILDGRGLSGDSFSIRGSPCEQVIREGSIVFSDRLSSHYPGSEFIAKNRFESYIGDSIRNSSGEIIGVLCILSRNPLTPTKYGPRIIDLIAIKAGADIERIRIEEILVNNEQMLADAMDLAKLAGWEFDVSTQVFTFNDRFYALYGTTYEEEGGYRMDVSTYTREFVYPADVDIVLQESQRVLERADSSYCSDIEHRIIRRDGLVRYISVRIRVVTDEQGRVLKTYGANQDITEYKMIEETLKKSNAQLNLLTRITRHDIINKISGFTGYLSLIEMESEIEEINTYIQKMYLAIQEIQSLIDFSRIYEKLGTNRPHWISLPAILSFRSIPDSVTLTRHLTEISVFADPMIERVFSNLLDNSTRHGESVTEISISAHVQDRDLIVVWEDNGIGVPDGEKERIFESGYGKNTGLGLFLAREILSLTGIVIRETGVFGKGARFEIIVPSGSYTLVS